MRVRLVVTDELLVLSGWCDWCGREMDSELATDELLERLRAGAGRAQGMGRALVLALARNLPLLIRTAAGDGAELFDVETDEAALVCPGCQELVDGEDVIRIIKGGRHGEG